MGHIATSETKDTLVCLDDFERLSNSNISPEEVLGFISLLKEENNCKIVLILNEGMLTKEAKEQLLKYKEKIVDIELTFAPTTEEVTNIAFKNDMLYLEMVKDYCMLLDIKNIRVLSKIKHFTQLVHKQISNAPTEVINRSIRNIVITCAAYYIPDTKIDNHKIHAIPTLDFLEKAEHNLIQKVIKTQGVFREQQKEAETISPEEKERERKQEELENCWQSTLNSLDIHIWDYFDREFVFLISNGYLSDRFNEKLSSYSKEKINNSLIQKYHDAWKPYYNSLDKRSEFIEEIEKAVKEGAGILKPREINDALVLLRSVEQGELADELIEYYLKHYQLKEEIFESKSSQDFLLKDVTDDQLHREIQLLINKNKPQKSLKEVLLTAVHNGIDFMIDNDLRHAKQADFYQLFKEENGSADFNSIVRAALQFEHNEQKKGVNQKNAKKALLQIYNEAPSLLNKRRLKNLYNIDVDAPPCEE